MSILLTNICVPLLLQFVEVYIDFHFVFFIYPRPTMKAEMLLYQQSIAVMQYRGGILFFVLYFLIFSQEGKRKS